MELVEVNAATWTTFERLLGPGGVQGGCWCAYFRMTRKDFSAAGPAGRHQRAHDVAARGEPFGLVAVEHDQPIGWVSVSPRECFPRLTRAPSAKPEPGHDLSDTWSVVCFYLPREARGRHLTTTLLAGAVDYARRHGARHIEGYPVDTTDRQVPPDDLYHGSLSTFLAAGFELIDRRGAHRALVRKSL